MAAVPVLVRSDPLLFVPNGQPMPGDEGSKLQRSLETLFPDLLVHGTRNALLSMTTSLTKVSGAAHRYFARVSQILAFESMMRGFVRLAASVSPFPMDFMAANCWSQMLMGFQQAPSPWGYLAPAQQPQTLSPWAYLAPAQQPQTPPSPWGYLIPSHPQVPAIMQIIANAMTPQAPTASQSQSWPDCSALFIIPMALLAAAPAAENWWSFGFPN